MDETALPTVPKLSKAVAQKGMNRFIKAVSCERGTTTTLILCVSASVITFLLFGKKKMPFSN